MGEEHYSYPLLLSLDVPEDFPEYLLWQGPLVLLVQDDAPLVLPSLTQGIFHPLQGPPLEGLPLLSPPPLSRPEHRLVYRAGWYCFFFFPKQERFY